MKLHLLPNVEFNARTHRVLWYILFVLFWFGGIVFEIKHLLDPLGFAVLLLLVVRSSDDLYRELKSTKRPSSASLAAAIFMPLFVSGALVISTLKLWTSRGEAAEWLWLAVSLGLVSLIHLTDPRLNRR
ncbi:hypothetical protein [Streptomyces sp. NBC_00620]|uniref:hypothetical protein n=1 Tax=Streptomyces sp. NBC_00620 TaxID=2903666 RepID=UPI00225BFA04|nr:hypothetical protein [Streptomyces sp. NBC_00620]MCX4976262.1 hypothetical protein [Streptomyces sp. NBC_00620]